MDKKLPTEEQVTEFWLRNYIGKAGLCLLCENCGYVKTYLGFTVHCICPNGRALAKVERSEVGSYHKR